MKDDEILILIQYRIKQAEGFVEAIRKHLMPEDKQ